MDVAAVCAELESALAGRRLLDHAFYQRWSAGTLGADELAAYAGQYRHYEAALPELLSSIGPLVAETLADEVGRDGARSHLSLFDDFASAVGADETAATAATAELLSVSSAAGLAGLAAYEIQAASIAATKADGLRRWYGVNDDGARFWDVHAELDRDHADWIVEALAGSDVEPDEVFAAARRSADAWWAFLDEREASRPLELVDC